MSGDGCEQREEISDLQVTYVIWETLNDGKRLLKPRGISAFSAPIPLFFLLIILHLELGFFLWPSENLNAERKEEKEGWIPLEHCKHFEEHLGRSQC